MTCPEMTTALGAYVLGALDTHDRAQVEAHLHTCLDCRDQLADLAGLPGLMSKLTIDDVVAEPAIPPHDLYERVAEQARAEADGRRHAVRRRRLLAAVAAAVVVAGAGVGVSEWQSGGSRPPSFSAASGRVHMDVVLANQTSGTGFTVTVSGLPKEEHCWLVAVANDGTRDRAGSWTATYAGNAKVTGSTNITRSQLNRLVLLGTHGQQLVSVPV